MWESIVLTLLATAGNNIGKVFQKKGTVILPPLSFKLKVRSFPEFPGVSVDSVVGSFFIYPNVGFFLWDLMDKIRVLI